MSGRIDDADARPEVEFSFGGRPLRARQGDTIAMALWAAGQDVLRSSSRESAPRGVFCNMGICYECLVAIDGAVARACTTLVSDGMQVEPGGRP